MAAGGEDFEGTCLRAARILSGLEGYFLERVSADTAPVGGCVDICLRLGPDAVAVVTGANSGLGYVVGRELARKGARWPWRRCTDLGGEVGARS